MKKILVLVLFVGVYSFTHAQWTTTSGPGLKGIVKIANKGTDIYITSLESGVRVLRGGEIPWMGCGFTKGSYGFGINGEDLYVGTTMYGIFKSTDNGLTWNAKNTGIDYLGGMMDFTVKGTDMYVGSYISGVLKSTDNGESWTSLNNGLNGYTDVNAIIVVGDNIIVGTNGGGASISTDNATTWTPKNNGLPTTKRVRSLAVSGTTIIAGTYSGVFITNDNGENWTALNAGLGDLHVSGLAVSGSTIFAGTTTAGVFKTDISTANPTWTAINTGLTSASISTLSIIGTNLYAAVDESSTTNIWKRPLNQVTAVNSVVTDKELSIYPAIVNDKLTIEVSHSLGQHQLDILNIKGQLVYSTTINSKTTIDASVLNTGTYIVKLNDGKSIITKKFIKK